MRSSGGTVQSVTYATRQDRVALREQPARDSSPLRRISELTLQPGRLIAGPAGRVDIDASPRAFSLMPDRFPSSVCGDRQHSGAGF
ncbi:MAG: hypothetical protein A3H95_01710 [Acidobacteria bacterium RIFCSPLOWO2_02_FULL_64_15]|nr:MAG: hypothetical protein A3H95_01710 [Acidobacteria bacterium RIFCSPLOWO2_02_FULL_64_15]